MVSHFYPKTGVGPDVAVRNLQINMFWDGVFHAFTWLVTVCGVALLWRAGSGNHAHWSGKLFLGSLSLGWGAFNLVEGIINHHVLHLHHVTEDAGHLTWDLAFLGSAIGLIAIGCKLSRDSRAVNPRS
jgi:uncharacterized membrane protein